jgi:hypothetical protein
MKRTKQYKQKQKLRSYANYIKRSKSAAMFEWLKKLYVAHLNGDVTGFIKNEK